MSTYLTDRLAAAIECTGDRNPDNWEWRGDQHLKGNCDCEATTTLTYWALPSSRVLHGRKDCDALNRNAERRARREQRVIPDRLLEPGGGVPSTCGKCGNGLRHSIVQEQRRREEREA